MDVIKHCFPIKTLYNPRQTPLERAEGYLFLDGPGILPQYSMLRPYKQDTNAL